MYSSMVCTLQHPRRMIADTPNKVWCLLSLSEQRENLRDLKLYFVPRGETLEKSHNLHACSTAMVS